MVRKISACMCVLALIFAFGMTAQAVTHEVYDEGNISTTYVQYFKDIVSGIGFNDNYVAFRSGQYTYNMVVGDLKYNNGTISLNGEGIIYTFTQSGNYNSIYTLTNRTINDFSVNASGYIVYSDVGNFPQLEERGAKYEILSVLLLSIALLCVVVGRIFRKR